MTRSLRRPIAVAIILLWNVAAGYACVCQEICAVDDCPQLAAQASPEMALSSSLALRGAQGGGSHQDLLCSVNPQQGRCVRGPVRPQLRSEAFYAQPLLAAIAPVSAASELTAGPGAHYPPRSSLERLIHQKFTLLRI